MHQDSESPNILLNSKRVFLRRVENDDLELLTKLFCDPEMMHYLGRAWPLDFVTETMLEWHNEWGKNNYYPDYAFDPRPNRRFRLSFSPVLCKGRWISFPMDLEKD